MSYDHPWSCNLFIFLSVKEPHSFDFFKKGDHWGTSYNLSPPQNVTNMLSCCKPIHRFRSPSTKISCISPHERGIPPFWEIHKSKMFVVSTTAALSTTPRIRPLQHYIWQNHVTYMLQIFVRKSKLRVWSSSSAPHCFSCLVLYQIRKKRNLFRNPTVILKCVRHINLPFISVMYSFSCVSWFSWAVSFYREMKMPAFCMGCPYRSVQISLQAGTIAYCDCNACKTTFLCFSSAINNIGYSQNWSALRNLPVKPQTLCCY